MGHHTWTVDYMNTNDNVNDTHDTHDAITPADNAATVPATVAPKPTRTRTRATKPATAVKLPPMPRTIRNAADVVSVARHITPSNFDAMIVRFTANHGITLAARNVGRYTGSRIMDAQNVFMADNMGLNDAQILFALRVDFPAAVGRVFIADNATGVSIVRGIRAEYNRNGHGSKNDTWKTVKSEPFGPSRFEWPKPATTRTA